MSAFFSSDGSFSLQFAIIFVVIFLILAGGVLLLRRFTGQGASAANRTGLRGRQPRLGIVDIYELDRQRQLILLRRDNVEHLLLVGGPNDVVVERNITRGMNARVANEETGYDEPAEPAGAVPLPPQAAPMRNPPMQNPPAQAGTVQHLAEPFPPRPEPAAGFAASPAPAPYFEPRFEMPLVVPAPVPGSHARPEPAGPPLDLSAGSETEDETRSVSPAAPARAKDSPLARVIRRTPPSLVNLVPAALAERIRLPERAPAPEPLASPATSPEPLGAPVPEALPLAPVVAPPTARGIDAAILSDMARQLEEALRRPAAAVRPAMPPQATRDAAPISPVENLVESSAPEPDDPAVPVEPVVPVEPGPVATFEQAQPIDPVAAAMAEAARQPASAPPEVEAEVHDTLFTDTAPGDAPQPPVFEAEPTASAPVFVEAPAPTPAVPEAEAPVVHASIAEAPKVEEPTVLSEPDPPPFLAPAPQPPSPKPPASKPAASPNPFSVEEIEAEFARLLGRPLDRKQ